MVAYCLLGWIIDWECFVGFNAAATTEVTMMRRDVTAKRTKNRRQKKFSRFY